MRLAKYNVYRYIGCIIDQSNWFGPFSQVVMTPDFESENHGFKSRSGHLTGSFYLQVCFSSYYSSYRYIFYRKLEARSQAKFVNK